MPKQFEVLVSVLQKKTFIVEADDHKHARSEVERLGHHAESYVICRLVDTEHIEWSVLAVKGQEPEVYGPYHFIEQPPVPIRGAMPNVIDTCASEPEDADLLCVVCGESFDEKQMKYLAVSANGTRCQSCDTKVGRQ